MTTDDWKRERAKQLLGKIDRFSFSEHVDAMLAFRAEGVAEIIAELRRKANVGKVGADQQKGTVGFAVSASFAAAYNDFANELERTLPND